MSMTGLVQLARRNSCLNAVRRALHRRPRCARGASAWPRVQAKEDREPQRNADETEPTSTRAAAAARPARRPDIWTRNLREPSAGSLAARGAPLPSPPRLSLPRRSAPSSRAPAPRRTLELRRPRNRSECEPLHLHRRPTAGHSRQPCQPPPGSELRCSPERRCCSERRPSAARRRAARATSSDSDRASAECPRRRSARPARNPRAPTLEASTRRRAPAQPSHRLRSTPRSTAASRSPEPTTLPSERRGTPPSAKGNQRRTAAPIERPTPVGLARAAATRVGFREQRAGSASLCSS
jgi:hypothetical protein